MLMVMPCDTKIAEAHPLESDVSSRLHGQPKLSTPCSDKIWESVCQINAQALSHQTRCGECTLTVCAQCNIELCRHDVSSRAPAVLWVAFCASRTNCHCVFKFACALRFDEEIKGVIPSFLKRTVPKQPRPTHVAFVAACVLNADSIVGVCGAASWLKPMPMPHTLPPRSSPDWVFIEVLCGAC